MQWQIAPLMLVRVLRGCASFAWCPQTMFESMGSRAVDTTQRMKMVFAHARTANSHDMILCSVCNVTWRPNE